MSESVRENANQCECGGEQVRVGVVRVDGVEHAGGVEALRVLEGELLVQETPRLLPRLPIAPVGVSMRKYESMRESDTE